MRIAIAGGTGMVGRRITEVAEERGHETVVLSRRRGVDVLTGGGLRGALAGVDVVIDALNIATQSARKATEFFTATSRNLLEAEERSGVGHHIVLSIVGIDAADAAYYAGKLAQERLVEASTQPHTIARAAQFHEFAGQIIAQTTFGPLTLAPRMLSRPVAAREVGEHLVDIAEDGPAGRAADLVGPEEITLAAMIRRQYAHDGVSRRVLELRLPGTYWRGLASGALRGDPRAARIGEMTFDQWLDSEDRRR
jgi:uncharacterized protein YbjT (DUF2867 family)